MLRVFAVPRGESADNADLTFSPDGRHLAVSAGNSATLWDIATGKARRWPLPWAQTEALAFAAPDRLMLFRSEVRDGPRPLDSVDTSSANPKLCVLRNLLGPRPDAAVKVISDFSHTVKEIEASPDGACFVIEGVGGSASADHRRLVRVYKYDGTFLTEFSTQRAPRESSTRFLFDPAGTLLAHQPGPFPERRDILLELSTRRFLGPAPVLYAVGFAQRARLWALSPSDSRLQLTDGTGNVLVEQFPDHCSSLTLSFSPDHDGRYLLWGNPTGTVTLADLVEIRRRLEGIKLGW